MIKIKQIKDEELDFLFQKFEACISFAASLEPPIKLSNYGYFLRLALNTLQDDEFDYLMSRLKSNKDLERNEGGYDIEYFGDNNPKEALTLLINHLKNQKSKTVELLNFIKSESSTYFVITDREDVEFIKSEIPKRCVTSNLELKRKLKKNELKNEKLIFYSFNGMKDFDFLYGLFHEVILILYKQEVELYNKQLQIHKNRIEQELTSNDRFSLCGIKYEPIIAEEIKVNPTLEKIIERLDERSKTAYEGYRNESDSLFDDLEEQIHYQLIFSDNSTVDIESNETVFDNKGNLIKSYKLRKGDKVRIYPKEQLAENLLQIAIESEPEIFGKVEEHANLWLNTLKELDKQHCDRETLYKNLKQKGLRVLPATVDAYFRGYRKYPMFNCDLKAIIYLSENRDLIGTIPQILKSKRLYNSTMIALGRGIKQELKLFLKEETLGDILSKRNFTKETLDKFIAEKMPLLTINDIKTISYEQAI